MAAGLMAYSGIVTKVRAMQANLITEEEFSKIVESGSVAEVISFLKDHEGYSDIFRDADTNLHRGQVEHELAHSLHEAYAKIYRFAKMKQRKAIRILFYRFEVRLIKVCLQKVMRDNEEAEEVDLSIYEEFFQQHSKINMDALMNATTLDAFLEVLKDTDYYEVLKDVQNIPHPTLFDYETRLDVYYYQKIWKIKDDVFSGKEKKEYANIIGQQIDLLNMMWVYRFKTFFNTDDGQIMQSLIPIQYHLKKKQLADMVTAETKQDMLDCFSKTFYSRLFRNVIITRDDMEKTYHTYLYRIYSKEAKQNPYSLISIQFYLYRKEREIDVITSAIECVRYQLPAEKSMEILKAL